LIQIETVAPAAHPMPADRLSPHVRTPGFLFFDGEDAWRPDPALQAFLDAGPPPVYVGFGSMMGLHPERLTRAVLEGVRRAGVRAALGKGWGGLAPCEVGEDVFMLDFAPHKQLFPLMAATVHHGGAGTTAAALRAGRPTAVCAFSYDQPWWGERVRDLGVGPRSVWARRLTGERFAGLLRELVDRSDYRRRAEPLAAKIEREDGVRDGVAEIARLLGA